MTHSELMESVMEELAARNLPIERIDPVDQEISCRLPEPLNDFGFDICLFIEDGKIKHLGVAAWESFTGSTLAESGFSNLDDAICWAMLQAIGCDATLQSDLARIEGLN